MISEENHKTILEDSLQDMLKSLTSSRQLAVKNFFEIKRVPKSASMLDVANFIRKMKLNFVVSINKRISSDLEDMRSYLIGVHNVTEFMRFKNSFEGKKNQAKIHGHPVEFEFLKRYDFRMNLALPPADSQIGNFENLPTVLRFDMNQTYNKFLPTIRLNEILLELSTLNILSDITGIALQYNAGSRLIKPSTFITSKDQSEEEIESFLEHLKNLNNLNGETLMEKIIVAHESIWSNEKKEVNEEGYSVYLLSLNLIKSDILSNGKSINAISNYIS